MIVRHAVVVGLAALGACLAISGCTELERAIATPTPVPFPSRVIADEQEFWQLVASPGASKMPELKSAVCDDPDSIDLVDVLDDAKERYAGVIRFRYFKLSHRGARNARTMFCDIPPTATAEVARRIVVTATPSPTPYVPSPGSVGGGRGWEHVPTSTPYPTRTPFPSATPIPPTLTPTPYPTPASKEYVEPEYITVAERVMNDDELQLEIYGRELDGDEEVDIFYGLIHWHTVDFLRRCMVERRMKPGRFHDVFASNGDGIEWEYPPATEKVHRRFPDAELVKDSSSGNFTWDSWHGPLAYDDSHYLVRKSNKYIYSIYFDPVEDTHIRAESVVDFRTCEPIDIERIKMGKVERDYKLGTSYIGSFEGYDPLEPHEVGNPVKITSR